MSYSHLDVLQGAAVLLAAVMLTGWLAMAALDALAPACARQVRSALDGTP